MATTKVNHPDLLDLASDTGATVFPKGTTAERPVSPEAGYIRFNTTDNVMETYDGTEWLTLDTLVNEYSVDYLVVAGGGGGGSYIAGGGGAGGLRTSFGANSGGGAAAENSLTLESGIVYSAVIGAGGVGGISGGGSTVKSSNGFSSSFATIISAGGGGGGITDIPANANSFSGSSGGSGGGSRSYWGLAAPPDAVPGTGTSGQGYTGAQGTSGSGYGAGGGGSAGPGTTTLSGNTVLGGPGLAVSITGSSLTYAAGGRGGREQSPTDPVPSGAVNTGTGGDGRQDGTNASGGAGGSGVVILRMPTANYSGNTTGSPTVTTDGSDTILTYTSSGTYTA